MAQEILKAIRAAGKIMLQADDIGSQLESKEGTANFVTKYDYEVQEYLKHALGDLLPEAVIIGEEGEEEKLYHHKLCFIIDPIDGTTNFIFDNRHSAITVALMQEGKPIFGAVYNPYQDELFYACKGKGATLSRRSGDSKLTIRNLSLKKGLSCFGTSPYYRDLTDQSFELARKLFENSLDLRRTGSAALDLSYIAAGRFVLFAEYVLQPWDYSAASLIIEEAGGMICDLEGKALTYDKPSSVLAGTPKAMDDFSRL
jgi:myo-inositol-1(or 4)-monophosphatase